ncbi:transmembrane protein [Mycobacteroides abscessus]|nr:transmembrane protein [Mycobacteroides abscessus]
MTDSDTPWVEGIVSAMCVAVVVAVAVVVLSLGLIHVHPLWAILLNIVAVGGLSPTLWSWRDRPGCAGLCWVSRSAWPVDGWLPW